ncbi:HopJ type III effector protein [Vibrio amylolyticus]|uniref:HopJ type III effector protein n=1 Tax=Vibrio TaxID=662 RepID=UPI000C821D6E|nr:HopJ type III effector protein [Vibrio sp. 10N.261.55.A7]PMJ96531.1 type III effector [Vibrio sp. 10N.261.55.A7]
MELSSFLEQLNQSPESIEFEHTITIIEENYEFTPAKFINGATVNEENQNNGSCKIFAFGKLLDLTEPQTLACFGKFYRVDVLQNPDNDDHQNIRNFMTSGWKGISFESNALSVKE